jgi:signal transduction histidine kinase
MLHDLILANRDEILARTRKLIDSNSDGADPLPIDRLPLFLDQLGDALLLAGSGGTVTRRSIADSALARGIAAVSVGGLTVEGAIREYGALCGVISRLAIERDSPISTEEFLTLDVCLDDAVGWAFDVSALRRPSRVRFHFEPPHASGEASPDEVDDRLSEDRAHTDASLGAERAGTDAATGRAAIVMRHALDDRLDRDRIVADEGLLQFREDADRTLADARSGSPAPNSSVAIERDAADDGKNAEREITDALLDKERQRADTAVESRRREHDAEDALHEARRHETDEHLSAERVGADVTATALSEAKIALVHNKKVELANRKVAEKALQESERQLRHSQKMDAIGRLAGGIAHDFNNILSVILSHGELLLEELKPGDPVRDDIEEIHKAGKRAADLTRQLLMFSRQQVIEPKVLDLNDLLGGMDRMLQRILGADVDLVSIPGSPLGRVRVDPGSLEQVVMNLVVNARDAMPTGGMLTLETANVILDDAYAREHHGVDAGSYVMLAATDTGGGMDKATQAHIFEPFFTTKGAGKGTGLGLSTVFGIVRQSGGSVWVYSEPGKGTTFKIYLPCVDAPVQLRRSAAPPSNLRGTETILLVEDDDQVRAVAQAILRKNGYQVVEARNAGEALMHSEKDPRVFDLLLTDVVMPQVSGPELAKRLSIARPDMKVLCMSGYTDDSIVRHGVLEAHIAYLQKPITTESLATKVREVLDSPRLTGYLSSM